MLQSAPSSTPITLQSLDLRSPPFSRLNTHPRPKSHKHPSTSTRTMTSHPNMFGWTTEVPSLLAEHDQDFEHQNPLQPLWPWVRTSVQPSPKVAADSKKAYEPSGYEPQSEDSTASSPDSSYHQGPLEIPYCNPEDYLDLQRIGTPSSSYEELQESTQVRIDTTGTGANKRMRRREQNRASQRAYRDRQRGKISELQSKVVALKAQNEKLQARNEMLEAAFQRDKGQFTSEPASQRNLSGGAGYRPHRSS